MNNLRRLGVLVAIAALIAGIGGIAQALKAPHDYATLGGCNACHVKKIGADTGFLQMSSFDTFCFNAQHGCHNLTYAGSSKAPKKAFNKLNASNKFGNLPQDLGGKKQSSHGWKIPNTNPAAGVTVDWHPMTEAAGSKQLYNHIGCTRCHRAHGDYGPNGETIYRKFLKADPTGDNICYQCHAARRVGAGSARTYRDTGAAGATHQSHPVEVNYSAIRIDKAGFFEITPQLTAGYDESARPRLYTTIGGTPGAVVCSSCHGPLHSSDSNPYTFDNISAFAFRPFSSSPGGALLRTYPPSRSNALCQSCHKVEYHKNYTLCNDCHEPHKKPGDTNIYLIRTSIMSPWGKRSVYFTSTTQMAKRYGIYSGSTPTDKSQRSTAICQVCHSKTQHHRAYSTTGADRAHNTKTGGYEFCPRCHKHTNVNHSGAFKPAGCSGCHNDPPTIGKHAKHVGSSSGYDTWHWDTGQMTDKRSDTSYGFSCGRCHNPWTPYTATYDKYIGRNHYGSSTDTQKVYTADMGFKNGTPLPQNPSGSYAYGGAGTVDKPGSISFRTPSSGTCSNLYCHGQFYGGYTSNNPVFNGVSAKQSCVGSCHGTNAANLPGVNGTGEWGNHRRHVGNAQYAQYGYGSPNFRCNACHYATASLNNETTITSRMYHVNGKVNVRFDPLYGSSASTYNGLNDYSGVTNTNLGSKTPYKGTCSKIYCHSDGSRLQGNYSSSASAGNTLAVQPNWSSVKNFTSFGGTTTKRRCARCHGSVHTGITAAMPEYSRSNKGNSHPIHVITNGFMCNVCHNGTTQDNKSIYDTTKHVNKQYDISIITRYNNSGMAAYSSTTHTCTNVKCHGNQRTPSWGTAAVCQNCHLSPTGDVDKRILPRSKFTSWTSTVPKIYSTAWANVGHGRSGAGNPYYSGNPAAGKNCYACHGDGTQRKVATKHGTANNPFRLYTAPDRPNVLCSTCHGPNGSAMKNGIFTHESSVTGQGNNYAVKCIDCHDPHGDNNIFMLHSTLPRPAVTTRNVPSGMYGIITSTSNRVNVDFTQNTYSSDYARHNTAPKVCQVCHQETQYGGKARFRYYTSEEKTHGTDKCTSCHQHSGGFKGAGCNACHGNPPDGTKSILGGISTTNSQNASGAANAGSHKKHIDIYGTSGGTSCSYCHQGGMYSNGAKNTNIDIGFSAFGLYTGSGQKYGGQSGVQSGFYGYSGKGIQYDGSMRCNNMKCHGGGTSQWLTKNFGTPTAPQWGNPATAKCGKCHGAKKAQSQGSWPTTNAHAKHAGTNVTNGAGYDFMCKLCHNSTVLTSATTLDKNVHVNGQANFQFYTGTGSGNRVWSQSNYTGGDTKVNSTFGWCKNTYCHSRGTKFNTPYDGAALSNFTALWSRSESATAGTGQECSFCHGNKVYKGITSAMPNYPNNSPKINSHKKHVVDNGFSCYACHRNTVNTDGRSIASTTYHINKTYDIRFASSYSGVGGPKYNGNSTCSNIKCHGGRTTPVWGTPAVCQDCHYQVSGAANAEDKFTFTLFTSSAPKIYSSEWTKRGHGATTGGTYPFSSNNGAGKTCTICHSSSVSHGSGTNFFRLRTTANQTSDPDKLCASCHGTGTQVGKLGAFGVRTGIQSHTWANLSTNGYTHSANTGGKAGWNITPKCVDCHDPHGDRNDYMIHSFINMSGSDTMGRPSPTAATAQMVYTAVGGPMLNWSSYVKPDFSGLCQRCHSPNTIDPNMANFSKNLYTNHQRNQRCTNCHKHKKGFTPSGCDSCHGYPPAPGPKTYGWMRDSATNYSSLHIPHAQNLKNMSGIPAENDVTVSPGFKCNRCHAGVAGSTDPGYSATHMTGVAGGKVNAVMTNMTMVYGKWSKGAFNGATSVADDTCWNVKCHTPRSYKRQWKKPADCGACHGYSTRIKGAGNSRYNLHTTGSHKIHINYTSSPSGSWKKNYGFLCTQCHVNNGTNYTSHYNGKVDINFKTNTYNLSTSALYSRGTRFKGFTTGNEALGSCSKAYCHGRFVNGTTATIPQWKKGAAQMTCISCHKGRLTFGNGSTMPERHQKHVKANQYGFACARCHSRTTNNVTTILLTYSSHVNGRKDVYFDNFGNNFGNWNNANGTFDVNMKCKNIYCHSSGARSAAGVFTTRTTLGNYTANWNDSSLNTKTGNRPCSYCHGNKTYKGITAAMPNYTSSWGNSHRRHVISENFPCYVCHAATVNAAGVIISNSNHVNGFKNISIINTYKIGQTLYSSSMTSTKKTCKNVKCHGGNVTPKWGTYANCLYCHKSNTGDVNKRVSANNTFQSFSETAAKIYSSQWAASGHGRSGSVYTVSGNQAANRVCTDCHGAGETRGTNATRHGTAGNPFRLLTAPDRPDMVCIRCHGVGATVSGVQKTGIQSHASSITGQGHNYAMKCIDCHDPHGDNNAFMIHSTIGRPSSLPAKRQSSDSLGRRFLNLTGRYVAFTAKNYSSDYALKATAPKICQVCHTQTYKPTTTTKSRFRWNGTQDSGHGTDRCTGCHSHSGGFKGVACDGCHGFPPTSAFNMLSGPGRINPQTSGIRFSGATSAGAHKKHTDAFGKNATTCSYCHQGGMYGSGTMNTNIDIGFLAFTKYTGNYGGKSATKSGFYGYSGKGINTYYNGTARCNVTCHGGSGWLTKNFGTPTAPAWVTSTQSGKCGKCHGAKKASGVAGGGTWPTSNAHAKHAGTGAGQMDYMCKLCHDSTVQANNTTLNYPMHVNGQANVYFGTSDPLLRTDANSAYSDPNGLVNKAQVGKCTNTYCHSKGTNRVASYNNPADFSTWTATWNDTRGSFRGALGAKAKCNYCHGSKMFTGVTAAMPYYPDLSPKANKHLIHVKTYGFLCTSCHTSVTVNNTSIDGVTAGLHVNRAYNLKFNANTRTIDNSLGTYTSIGSSCQSIYCHSSGNIAAATLPNYTAKWGDSRGSYFKPAGGMAKCNYCHGSKTLHGMTSAMPSYVSGSPKANRHDKHVRIYGFTCAVCHKRVTTNNTSIDAAGGGALHVNNTYNVDFSQSIGGRPLVNNTGIYKYQIGLGSSCKNTYCHSRGTKFSKPYLNRTSFPNFTAQWGDTPGSFRGAKGAKAKCNYCHGNRVFTGVTAAMPNYSSYVKSNSHGRHVVGYGFTCTACHELVTANNTSIDVAGGKGLHVNGSYNVNFNGVQRGAQFINNTGSYSYLTSKSRCKNTYCHSKGTRLTRPFSPRTSMANFTAMWGDTPGSFRAAKGAKAKCNYCHGNKVFIGVTAAMPNYSSYIKANSHSKHVVSNGVLCSTCHYGVARNNTSISDTANHMNGFYNISIAPGFRQVVGKTYSMVYNGSGGTCKNVKCHGGNPVKWGSTTVSCRTCHFDNAADNDKYGTFSTFRGAAPKIYSADWGKRGHGKQGRDCLNCHNSGVQHNGTYNPFRLFTSDPNALCGTCHGVSIERGKWGQTPGTKTDILTHSKANTGGDASWNNFSTTAGRGVVKCIDCHDPHGDKNYKMIQAYINFTGSDRFGRPVAGSPWTQLNANAVAQMTYTTWGSTQAQWSSFANGNPAQSICRRCHTPNNWDPNMGNQPSAPNQGLMTKVDYNSAHQSHQPCTNCHNHGTGFKGAGEPTGDDNCDSCHSGLLTPMHSNANGYHHVMINASGVFATKTSFGPGDMYSKQRRCLMCHVKHKNFSPGVTAGRKRARNLRYDAIQTNMTSGVNTDFWPAKRNGKYAASNPITPTTSGSNGVCISCHKSVQNKNTTSQMDAELAVRTPRIKLNLFTSSSHNFQIISSMSKFTDGSRFRANCLKCHGTYAMNKTGGAQGREEFALHDTKYQSLNRPMGGITGFKNPLSKQLCYRCHGTGARGSYDYYSTVPMDSSAKMIQDAVEAKTSGHPVGAFTGHRADEMDSLSQGWWGASGVNKHVECTDCHNTHGGNASIVRNVGSPTGNQIAGAQFGVWGVKPGSWPTAGTDIPSFAKVTSVTYQYQVCAKCHSKFAFGSNTPPAYPSAGYNNLTGSPLMTDVMKEFNPNNYGYHPVIQTGRNQPPANTAGARTNPSWPAAAVNVKWRDAYNNVSGYSNISGLDWAFIPPWNRRSTMACTDCHKADNTGQAVAVAPYVSTVSNGGWTGDTNLGDTDTNYATSSGASVLKVDVGGAPAFTGGNPIYLTIVGKSSANRKTLTYNVYKSGSSILSSATPQFSTGVKTISIDITSAMTTNTCTDSTCVNSNIAVDLKSTDGTTIFSIDKVSVDSTFAMTESLRGPHGSMMQWILASVNTDYYVDWNKNGSFTDAGDRVNDPTYINQVYETRTFCWNCHRFRTYQLDTINNGNYSAAEGQYSRFQHWQLESIAGTSGFLAQVASNKWGIPCMFCHGGGNAGAIHGDWQGTTWDGVSLTNARPVSVRLLNGAGAHYQVVTSGSPSGAGNLVCYIGGGAGNDNNLSPGVGGCSGKGNPEGTVASTIFNYSYTAY